MGNGEIRGGGSRRPSMDISEVSYDDDERRREEMKSMAEGERRGEEEGGGPAITTTITQNDAWVEATRDLPSDVSLTSSITDSFLSMGEMTWDSGTIVTGVNIEDAVEELRKVKRGVKDILQVSQRGARGFRAK